ncbi:MAG: protein-tyrosine-phosphatase [Saprospiraceae bacterium]|nr:protein-tyrosine-phosphatase [Saprospiraceae bacterium]
MTEFFIIIALITSNLKMVTDHTFYPQLEKTISALQNEAHLISDSRKEQLDELAEVVLEKLEKDGNVSLNFICTHNSRRSQLSELWFRTAAAWYGIEHVFTYSGGTESTAFNHRMVAAVERAGFHVKKLTSGSNPKYIIQSGPEDHNYYVMYSKKYSESYNPQSGYIAVMVCSQADEGCPVVFGADARISLPYEDPKNADGTEYESKAYDDKVREIGREMLYVMKMLQYHLAH